MNNIRKELYESHFKKYRGYLGSDIKSNIWYSSYIKISTGQLSLIKNNFINSFFLNN